MAIDKDNHTVKAIAAETNLGLAKSETALSLVEQKIKRYHEESQRMVKGLTERIDKAEKDRMHKYYRQVAELNDWSLTVQDKIDSSATMCDALGNYF